MKDGVNVRDRRIAWPVLACLFAALIVLGSWTNMTVPGTPVPIILANLFVILAGLILGPLWGTAAVAIYLVVGLVGAPVFSKGGSGIAHIMGPTGGFLFGYLIAALAAGLLSRIGKPRWWTILIAAAVAALAVYAVGVPWFKAVFRLKDGSAVGWAKALALSCLPYLPGDALKVALAIPLALRLRPWLEDAVGGR